MLTTSATAGLLIFTPKPSKNDYILSIGVQFYELPIMLTETACPRWCVIHVIERQVCPSISANRTWNAHDFSVVGKDVKAGETVKCRAWMVYDELTRLDDTLKVYARFRPDGPPVDDS